MNIPTIITRIQAASLAVEKDELKYLLARYEKQADTVAAQTIKQLAYVALAWLIILGIAQGTIGEGQISGFKITQIKSVLSISPLAIAILYYLAMSSLAATFALQTATTELYKALYPAIHRTNLHILTRAPTILEATELMALSNPSKMSQIFNAIWPYFEIVLIFLIPLCLIAHTSYLAIFAVGAPPFLSVTASALAILIWVRSVSVAAFGFGSLTDSPKI